MGFIKNYGFFSKKYNAVALDSKYIIGLEHWIVGFCEAETKNGLRTLLEGEDYRIS